MHEDDDDRGPSLEQLAAEALRQAVVAVLRDASPSRVVEDCTQPELDELDDDEWDAVVDLVDSAVVTLEVSWL